MTHSGQQESQAWIHIFPMLLRTPEPPILLHTSLLLETALEMLSVKSPRGGRMVESLACVRPRPTTRGARAPSAG